MKILKKGLYPHLRFLLFGFFLLLFSFTGLTVSAAPNRSLTEFDVFQAELGSVLRSLAELGDFNLLLDPKITGTVTLKLNHRLGSKETVELLAKTHGYSVQWLEEAQTMIIGDHNTFHNFEVKETRVYQLNYARGEELVRALQVAIPTEQVGVDVRTNQLTIYASVLEHQNIAPLIARLDRKMPQVKIDARVEEVRRAAMRDLGITWGIKDFSLDSKLHFNLTTIQTLQALEEQSNARLLANPNVSSIDGKEAKIFIGDKFPVITTKQSENGLEYQIEYIEVGTILTITPVINEPQVVTVTVKAEVSTIVEWKKTGSGDDIPVIRTREASSVVRLKENEVFVLSGLNLSTEVDTEVKVPFLSKIPLLGKVFFSNKQKGPDEDTEIYIFLTPKIVDESEPAVDGVEANEHADEQFVTMEIKGEECGVKQEIEGKKSLAHAQVKTEQATTVFSFPYCVQKGDSFNKVGIAFGIAPELIAAANPQLSEEELTAGQPIVIPVPANHLYRLKAGETIWHLAQRYGLPVAQLTMINQLPEVTNLKVGQLVVLPTSVEKVIDPAY